MCNKWASLCFYPGCNAPCWQIVISFLRELLYVQYVPVWSHPEMLLYYFRRKHVLSSSGAGTYGATGTRPPHHSWKSSEKLTLRSHPGQSDIWDKTGPNDSIMINAAVFQRVAFPSVRGHTGRNRTQLLTCVFAASPLPQGTRPDWCQPYLTSPRLIIHTGGEHQQPNQSGSPRASVCGKNSDVRKTENPSDDVKQRMWSLWLIKTSLKAWGLMGSGPGEKKMSAPITTWPLAAPSFTFITCQTQPEAAAKKPLSLIYYWAVKGLLMAVNRWRWDSVLVVYDLQSAIASGGKKKQTHTHTPSKTVFRAI